MELHGLIISAGFLVGIVVGMTGVGGGALMTPILVLVFGVAPHTSIGTDLLNASIMKMVGTAVHAKNRSVDWQVVGRLALGSLPAAVLTLLWMGHAKGPALGAGFITKAVGWALILTSAGMLIRMKLEPKGRWDAADGHPSMERLQQGLTVLVGGVLGLLVTLTSIGAGALGAMMLVYLYPKRMEPRKLVGTDLAHAIPLALVAGLGHLRMGNVNPGLLGNLLLGSIPGVLLGTTISCKAPQNILRGAIALVLAVVAFRMLVR